MLYAVPGNAELVALAAEKARNALGLLSIADAQRTDEALSLASLGEELGESALIQEVTRRHPSVVRTTDTQRFPQHIDWDYYGTV